jgi:hypothetical protein
MIAAPIAVAVSETVGEYETQSARFEKMIGLLNHARTVHFNLQTPGNWELLSVLFGEVAETARAVGSAAGELARSEQRYYAAKSKH